MASTSKRGNSYQITISNRLGHAQTSTTLSIYAAALKKKNEEAANSLESIIKRKS